jgi:molybdenum cofactor cytidylyltransferase
LESSGFYVRVRRGATCRDGDIGARHLISRHGEAVAEVPVEGFGAFLDIDTPQALEAARRS